MSGSKHKVILRSRGLKPLTLQPGGRVRVGRKSDNDVILKGDPEASRNHASFVWDPDEDRPYVEDHDSANGVTLNGEEVEGREHLSDGSQVRIGQAVFACEFVAELANQTATHFNLSDSSGEFFLDTGGGPFKGLFDDAAQLQAALVQAEGARRTGTLFVRFMGKEASLTLAKGRVMAVQYGDLEGVAALKCVLELGAGTYELSPMMRPSEEFLDLSLQEFIGQGR